MFYFVVRHLRFLARIPFLPHLFESILLTHTFIWHRETLKAIEELELITEAQLSLTLTPHKMGGLGFVNGQREIGHIHGNGLLDVKLDRVTAARLLRDGEVQPHHVLPGTGWVSYQLKNSRDLRFAQQLLELSIKLPASPAPDPHPLQSV